MARSNRSAEDRRKLLIESTEKKKGGGLTLHGARAMADGANGTQTTCTVTGYCRTFLYEFPASHFPAEPPDVVQIVCDTDICRAAIVTDPLRYIEKGLAGFMHYEIDASLRDGVGCAYRDKKDNSDNSSFPIFLVVEQHESFPATTFSSGECFLIGEEFNEGGQEGERALLAIRTTDGAWPEFAPDMHGVNMVLAAVKAEQNVTHSMDPLHTCSCFVSDDHRAVYTHYPTMSIAYGGVRTSSPVSEARLQEKADQIRTIHEGLLQDSATHPQIAELVDSVNWEKNFDEAHFRLWYLRLWQALADTKKLLGKPDLEDSTDIIAGEFAPRELKNYRHSIAHWWTGKVDYKCVTGIQQTVGNLLRGAYAK